MPIGTRVRLASGGPVMLVADYNLEKMEIFAVWEGGGEAWFPIVCLDIIRNKHYL